MSKESKSVARLNDPFARVPGFDHAAAASKLAADYNDANHALRRVVAFGLSLFELTEIHLKHGQFGPWLTKYAPQFCDARPGGAPIPNRTLRAYRQLTQNVLEACGVTVEQALELMQSPKWQHAATLEGSKSTTYELHAGEILLLPDAEVPESARELRQKMCDLIDGKSMRQLMLDFKSVEADPDEPGKLVVKSGRRKGEGGVSHEQRVNARALEAANAKAARIGSMKLCTEFLLESADDKHFGLDDENDPVVAAFWEAMDTAMDYRRNLLNRRRGK